MSTTLTNVKPARVEIDAETHEAVFDALVLTDQRWNGWAIPYFTLDEVRRIAAWIGRTGEAAPHILIDSDGETVILVEDYGSGGRDDTPDDVAVHRMSPLDGRYSVGGMSWTWTELDEGAPTDPDELDAWLAERAVRARVWSAVANALNAERVKNGEPYDADFRRRQHDAANAAVNAFTK